MKSVLLCLLSFLFSTNLWAKPKAYFDADDNFWRPNHRIVVDGKEYRPGFFGFRNIDEAMKADPLAQALASDYECYSGWAQGFFWGGLIASVVYSAASSSDDYEAGIDLGLLLAGFLPAVYFGAKAHVKLTRAINQYNGIYQAQESSWEIRPATKGLGLAVVF